MLTSLLLTGLLLQTPALPPRPQITEAFMLQTSGSLYNQLIAAEQYSQTLERRIQELNAETVSLKERLKKYEEAPASPAPASSK